jgi:hypothetical protein
VRKTLFASASGRWVAVVALLLSLAACRKQHLGADHGVAYKQAFASQVTSDPERKPTYGAADAATTVGARRGAKPVGAAAVTPMSATMPAPTMSTGAWPGAQGNITLEAK